MWPVGAAVLLCCLCGQTTLCATGPPGAYRRADGRETGSRLENRGRGGWLRTSSEFGRKAVYMGGHPSSELGRRCIGQGIQGGLGIGGLERSSQGGRVWLVEGILGVALVGLVRRAVAFHRGRRPGEGGRRRRQAAGGRRQAAGHRVWSGSRRREVGVGYWTVRGVCRGVFVQLVGL